MPESYIPDIDTSRLDFELPNERIALYPLADRASSRLLVCDAASRHIDHRHFHDLPSLIPSDAMLVVNDTCVVRARVVLTKPTGGRVEIFLLEPMEPSVDPVIALSARGEGVWQCLVGGARKLREGSTIEGRFSLAGGEDGELVATIEQRLEDGFLVRLRWTPAELTLAEMLEGTGRIPLPPYIKRDAEASDATTYQTVYAEQQGAVAAPTAGLHFTPEIFDELTQRGVSIERLTLHVGAGTFRQVQAETIAEHRMHGERISVSASTLRHLIEHAERRAAGPGSPFVIVGTTSLRTIESLYWWGARLVIGDASSAEEISIGQWDPYRLESSGVSLPDLPAALRRVEEWMGGAASASGRTEIMIAPGYTFRACDALVTNFHQPGSTLILLVAALLGEELWRRVYDEAMREGYRWLSYGDSSLLTVARPSWPGHG